jgi:Flp pilus assembly pilin Flp
MLNLPQYGREETASWRGNMHKLYNAAIRLWKQQKGQDLVEYALLAASVAVVAGIFFPPTVMPAVSGIFSQIVAIFNQSPG